LSAWVPGKDIYQSATAQPEFWNGIKLTWPILARVNGKLYSLFGSRDVSQATAATTTAVTYTASHTYIDLLAGEARFTLDFFSPVLPGKTQYSQQSLPYSYLTVSTTSNNDKPVDVQVMSAIDYTWTAQEGRARLNYNTAGNVGFFWFYNPGAIPFTERKGMASYGSVVFGTASSSAMSSACDSTNTIVQAFAERGSVDNQKDRSCSPTDLAALSKDLGTVGSTAQSFTLTIGVDREYAVNFLNTTVCATFASPLTI
jgi:hypothetical protein